MNRFWKCSLSFLIIVVMATAALAGGPKADRQLLVVADTEHGLALVPEGTPLPRGLALRVSTEKREAVFGSRQPMGDDSTLRATAEGELLRFAHAPEKVFEKARAAVARGAKLHPPGFRPAPNDFIFGFQVYFSDIDGYVEADIDFVSYAYTGARTVVFLTANNNFMWGNLYATQSSTLSPDAFAGNCYTTTTQANDNYCTVGYLFGTAVSGTVTYYGRIQGRTYDGCGYAGASPCTVFHSATITILYSWNTQSEYDYSYDSSSE